MDGSLLLQHLRRDGEAMAAAVATDLSAPVPRCPGWTVADLAAHTGSVHRWAAAIVRTQAQDRISRRDLPPPPEVPAELVPWFRDGVTALLDALEGADPTAPMWSFGADRTARFWIRRQAQETSVHRWDAETAVGVPRAVDPELAADGVDEIREVFLPNRPAPDGGTGTLRLTSTDLDRTWTFPIGDAGLEAAATGPTSDLLLFLWGRVDPTALTAEGDGELLTRWQDEVRF